MPDAKLDPPAASVHGPYEDVVLAFIRLIERAMDGQPPEVRAELWKMYIEDLRNWREFWKNVGTFLRIH